MFIFLILPLYTKQLVSCSFGWVYMSCWCCDTIHSVPAPLTPVSWLVEISPTSAADIKRSAYFGSCLKRISRTTRSCKSGSKAFSAAQICFWRVAGSQVALHRAPPFALKINRALRPRSVWTHCYFGAHCTNHWCMLGDFFLLKLLFYRSNSESLSDFWSVGKILPDFK